MESEKDLKLRSPVVARSGKKKQPLYRSVTDELRRQLASGTMAAGGRLPTLRELARQFSVSTITVRQALRTLEQEGHLNCIPGVGTFIRPAVTRPKATDHITVAFATIENEDTFTNGIAYSVENACQERGWTMQLLNAQGDPQIEARNLTRLARSGANGAIVLPVGDPRNFETMVQLKLGGFPFVIVDRAIPGLKVDVVESAHERGAYLATQYFLERGHRRVFIVTQQPETMESVAARLKGYEDALVDHGLEPLRAWKLWIDEQTLTRGGRERRRWLGGCEAVRSTLETYDPPLAIFAHNAYSGWGVFEACRELGLKIPDEVSVICFDAAEFTRALSPPMTTVAQRTDEIGQAAMGLLERRFTDTGSSAPPQKVIIDVDLTERGSVADLR